jgi:dolichyl-phosphate beta-glucosyltransferase
MPGANESDRRLAIVVPAFNESAHIEAAVSELLRYLDEAEPGGQVIVVDDGSSDDTRALAQQMAEQDPRVRVLGYDDNRGKGHAVRAGVLAADAEVICFLDADQSTPVTEVANILEAVRQGAQVVIGSRFRPDANLVERQPLLRRLFGAGFRWLARRMLGLTASDVTCGFKGFTRAAARELFALSTINGWAFDAELLVIAQRLGLTVVEVPITWRDCRDSRVRPLANALEAWRQLRQVRRNLRERVYDGRPAQA